MKNATWAKQTVCYEKLWLFRDAPADSVYKFMVEFYYHRSFIVLAGHFGTAVKEEGWWEDGSEDI